MAKLASCILQCTSALSPPAIPVSSTFIAENHSWWKQVSILSILHLQSLVHACQLCFLAERSICSEPGHMPSQQVSCMAHRHAQKIYKWIRVTEFVSFQLFYSSNWNTASQLVVEQSRSKLAICQGSRSACTRKGRGGEGRVH